jgi:hypothetical protein
MAPEIMRDRPEPPSAVGIRLQAAIDGGRTGDKVPGFDPAAAPLSTDEEAGGQGITTDPSARESMRQAPAGIAADASGTDRAIYRTQDLLVWPVVGGMVLFAGVAVLLFLLNG